MVTQSASEKLRVQINELVQHCKNRQLLNQYLNMGIGLVGILLGLGATVSGIISDNAKVAAIFGAGSATTQGILFAYPVGRRERIHRKAVAKLENLLSDLDIHPDMDTAALEKLLAEFKEIRLNALLEDETHNELEESTPQPPSLEIQQP